MQNCLNKFGIQRKINWYKYQSKVLTKRQNQYLDFLIDSSFQKASRFFIVLFENEVNRKVHTGHYLPKVEIKDYNVMIDGQNFLISQLKLI